MKRIISLLIMIVLLFSTGVIAAETEYKVSDKEINLTTFEPLMDNSLPVIKEAADLTNVNLESITPESATNLDQQFNLMMASGDVADIVGYGDVDKLSQFGREGAFIPLNDLIEKYAPNLNAYLDANPKIRKGITSPDGNIYYIPHVRNEKVALGWFIRKDWLDKFGLEIPQTVDEYYQALKTFVEQDANDNGKRDEEPFMARFWGNTIPDGFKSLSILWNARYDWFVDDNGQVHYGQYDPEYKTAMLNLAKWYEEGLIDKEIFTRGAQCRDILFSENRGAALVDWFGSTSTYNQKMAETVDGFNLIPIKPPKGIDGVRREASKMTPLGRGQGWSISYSNKFPEETIKYFDFWWTDRGHRLFNFGIEGETYDVVNGKPTYQDWMYEQEKALVHILKDDFGGYNELMGAKQDIGYVYQSIMPWVRDTYKVYQEEDYMVDPMPKISFTTEEQKRVDKLTPDIDTYVQEMNQKWVLGAVDVEGTYEEYIQTLKNMDIDELIAIKQKAYDRYMNK